jgi:uncharacterized tellurite resistance protein B-like protein
MRMYFHSSYDFMYSPDVSLALGSIVYALSKVDGHVQNEEMQIAQSLLAEGPHGSLALSGYFLRANVHESIEEAYAFGMRRLFDKRVELTERIKKRFVTILLRVARSHKGMSPAEWTFIRNFWRDIQPL